VCARNGRVRIRCKVRSRSRSRSRSSAATLLRNGRVVATGAVERGRFSGAVTARSRRAAGRGTYTLVIMVGRGKAARPVVESV